MLIIIGTYIGCQLGMYVFKGWEHIKIFDPTVLGIISGMLIINYWKQFFRWLNLSKHNK